MSTGFSTSNIGSKIFHLLLMTSYFSMQLLFSRILFLHPPNLIMNFSLNVHNEALAQGWFKLLIFSHLFLEMLYFSQSFVVT